MNLIRTISFFLLLSIILSACNTEKEVTISTATETPDLKPNATSTPTLFPTATLAPPLIWEFYHLKFEFNSTSDWAEIQFLNPESIFSINLDSVNYPEATTNASATGISLFRPLESLNQVPVVTATFDILIDSGKIPESFNILSRHGGIGGSGLRITTVNASENSLLQKIDHYWTDPNNPGYNDTVFEISLTNLVTTEPEKKEIARIAPEKLLWAFYYPWTAWDLQADCTDLPLFPYQQDKVRSEETISRQIEQAKSAGIDGFLVSWVNDPDVNDTMQKLLDLASQQQFKIAIYLESVPDPNDRTVKPELMINWLTYAISRFGSHPSYMKVNEKPLIVIYSSDSAPLSTWQEIFSTVESRGQLASYMGMSTDPSQLDTFIGLHQYSTLGTENLDQFYKQVSETIHNYPLFMENPQQRIFAATVHTGFDDCPYHPPETTLFYDRENGEFYRRYFESAIASDPNWIFITSWNEYGETTHIEPSKNYGTLYLEITKEYADLWKNVLNE